MTKNTDVLIAGAGPTGMVMALSLAKRGVPCRIIDPRPGPVQQSRAMGVQARTLEFYRFMGIADAAIALGTPADTMHLVKAGKEITSFSIGEMGAGISPYPFMLTLAQDVHEAFLLDRLTELGVEIEWGLKLIGHEQSDNGVDATLQHTDGQTVKAKSAYLVGCDGANSAVRKGLKLAFTGGTNDGLFYVADVVTDRPSHDGFIALDEESVTLMFPVRTTGAQRLIGIVPPELAPQNDLQFENLQRGAEKNLGIKVKSTHWFSTYHVSHRVAERFQVGRVFIAGDAAHVHSPVGGQGMNTGIGDSINLAWKLAEVLGRRADSKLLNSYEPERIAFARKLVETTDEAFGPMVSKGKWSSFLRKFIAPNVLRLVMHMPGLPKMLFRTISQTRINYRDAPISQGKAGDVRGGDRLPWVSLPNGDNYMPLASMAWQLHIIGSPNGNLVDMAKRLGLETHCFAASEVWRAAGFQHDGAYLVRPDGYVALAMADQDVELLELYIKKLNLTFDDA